MVVYFWVLLRNILKFYALGLTGKHHFCAESQHKT